MNQDNKMIIKTTEEIIRQNTGMGTHCVLSLMDFDGYPTTSTITASKAFGIRQIDFCTGIGSNKVNRIKKCSLASVCFSAETYNITLVGRIEIITDKEVKKDSWYGGLENHFSGPEDENYCVLRFTAERYNLLVDWKEIRGVLED